MKHRFSISLLAFSILLNLILPVYALESPETSTQIIAYEDGSYLEIITNDAGSRATNTKSGTKTYNYRNNNDDLEWKAVLSASFTYTGTTSSCTSASCAVTTYSSDWYVVSKTTTRSGKTATTELTMGEKFLGITISKPSYTITLSCDANGVLS